MSTFRIDIRPAEQQAQRHTHQNALLSSRHLRAQQMQRLAQQRRTHQPLVAVNQEGDVATCAAMSAPMCGV
jgi:hypothetical protein